MSLQLYSASAGSGKTYTLTVEYIKLALQAYESRGYFRRILAVTFTTKAAEEMRSRIIEFLSGIAAVDTLSNEEEATYRGIISNIQRDYQLANIVISDAELIKRAQIAQQQILQDYGLFSVMTIDAFVQRLSSSFIEELNLPSQFEVLLDSNQLMDQLIDQLLDKVNQQGDPVITNLIIDFAKSEVGEGRSWNLLRQNLHDFLKICLNEDYYKIKKDMDPLRISDFLQIERQVELAMAEINNALIQLANQFLQVLADAHIEGDMLAHGKNSCAGYFKKIVGLGEFEEHKLSYLRTGTSSGVWTSSAQDDAIKEQVAAVSDQLSAIGQAFIELYDSESSRYFLFKLIKKDLKKIALLASITQELHQFQDDHSVVSISEFSKRLYDIIANDPVPFIYEKLGDRYNHILIDEFQDTSILQWQNFMPLLEHAVSQGKKNLIVGDAKQSIYKFRGGEVGLISSLKSEDNLFIEQKLQENSLDLERFYYLKENRVLNNLESNYRSANEIVQFNNEFFAWIAANPSYQELSTLVSPTYGVDLIQKPQVSSSKFSGQVDVLVYHKPLAGNHAELEAEWMLNRILELIDHELKSGFQYKDIAILTRKNKQSKFLAIQLKERNIPVISSDSLLVHYAKVVGFLISFMRLKTQAHDDFLYKELLFQFADLCQESLDFELLEIKHPKNTNYYSLAINYFEKQGYVFQADESHVVAWVYGLVSTFNLTRYTLEIEYLFKLLDIINEFVLQKSDDFTAFLTYYDTNKASFSIASPESDNAITITSIHRSKGLEYPVVISPFVSWTHQPNSEQIWFDLKPLDYDTLRLQEDRALNYYFGKVTPKELKNFDSLALQQQNEYDAVFLDSLNMLYVAFTRPKQHLHILLAKPNEGSHAMTKSTFQKSLGQVVLDYCLSNADFSANIPDYILEKDSVDYYLLQNASQFRKYAHSEVSIQEKSIALTTEIQTEVDFRIQTNKDDLFTSAQSKRDRGDRVHAILSKIPDFDFYVLNKAQVFQQIDEETVALLEAFMLNDAIKSFFQPNELLFSERDILCPDGTIIRPDRVIKQQNDVIIIDFKTGKAEDNHKTQLELYKKYLVELGYSSVKAVLIYIETQIIEAV
ncbi:MAG: UvrD-helicase domain-containing protein [Cytophagaceae bacterium]|nr:UvrD-helicase domain-containing protein [Cytophagaceae bacterium]MBP6093092.1 UvrD-helicase domain-containing protein [Cytophagaceae bacterium]